MITKVSLRNSWSVDMVGIKMHSFPVTKTATYHHKTAVSHGEYLISYIPLGR